MIKNISHNGRRKKIKTFAVLLVIASILTPALIYLPKRVFAASCTWSGASGDWETPGNWSNCDGGVPDAADDVTIDANVTVQLNAATTINSLTLGNVSGTTTPTLNFDYDAITSSSLVIDDGDFTVYTGATLTHTQATGSTIVGRMSIEVETGDATITGNINVSQKGYQGGNCTNCDGFGPDGQGSHSGEGGFGESSGGAGGAGHGGTGGRGNGYSASQDRAYGGITYGSSYRPTTMGSGGGSGRTGGTTNHGGRGGGTIQLIVAGTTIVNGTITSVGGNSTGAFANDRSGAGAGGSINIQTGSFSGSGNIWAKGGNGTSGGGDGGGGRIGIEYSGTNTFSGDISVAAGTGTGQDGEPGTSYIEDTTNGDITIPSHNYSWTKEDRSNWVFRNIQVDGDWTVESTSSGLFILQTTGDMTIGENADVTFKSFHSTDTDGRGVYFKLAGNLTIPSTSSITANAGGYFGGSANASGYGTGKGLLCTGSDGGGGGGYGGLGGGIKGGTTYGSATAPEDLGSGGAGGCGSGATSGGRGGGAIRINTGGTLTVNGVISAIGGTGSVNYYGGGGGSGGSIFLTVGTLAGTGTITVAGGVGGNGNNTGGDGGGGGRLSINYYTANNWTGTTLDAANSAPGGAGGSNGGVAGSNGSVTVNQAQAGYVVNLDSSLDAVRSSDWSTDMENVVNAIAGTNGVGIEDTSARRIAEFSLYFNGNRDLDNVLAGSDPAQGKAFFHVPSGYSNIDGYDPGYGDYTLYVPKGDRDTAVWICPNVNSFAAITTSCTNGYSVSEADSNVTIENINGQDYWVVEGLASTGGLGINTSGTPNMRVDLANEATSASDDIEVWFDTPTDITADSLIYIIYDSLFTGGSSLTLTDISLSCDDDGETGGTSTGMTALGLTTAENGYLVLDVNTDTCTEWIQVDIHGGNGNHLTNPGSAGNYSWAVLTDVSGDGLDDDSGATLAYVGDDNDVNITATVPPTIDMELFQQNSDTELTDTNACPLGVLSLNQVNTCIYDIGTGTNNASGVSIYITSDGALDDGIGNSISSPTGAVTAGEEEYGFYISDVGGNEYSSAGSFAVQHQALPTSATLLATSSTTGSGTTVGSSSQHLEITHAASMSTSTIVGSYNQVVTYTAYTN